MLTTDETKRIALIMWQGGPKSIERVINIINQLYIMADTVRVDFEAVQNFLVDLLNQVKK